VVYRVSKNQKQYKALKVATETGNPETVRFFELLNRELKKKGIVFDPLNMFDNDDGASTS